MGGLEIWSPFSSGANKNSTRLRYFSSKTVLRLKWNGNVTVYDTFGNKLGGIIQQQKVGNSSF